MLCGRRISPHHGLHIFHAGLEASGPSHPARNAFHSFRDPPATPYATRTRHPRKEAARKKAQKTWCGLFRRPELLRPPSSGSCLGVAFDRRNPLRSPVSYGLQDVPRSDSEPHRGLTTTGCAPIGAKPAPGRDRHVAASSFHRSARFGSPVASVLGSRVCFAVVVRGADVGQEILDLQVLQFSFRKRRTATGGF